MMHNVDERFLPSVEHRPQLVFTLPELQFVHSGRPFNAAYEFTDRAVARFGGSRPAIHDADTGVTLTYAEMTAAVNRMGNALRTLGLMPGERVVLRMPDVAELAIAQLAVIKVGGLAVPSSPLEGPRELAFLLRDTEATLVIVHDDCVDALHEALSESSFVRVVIAVPGMVPDYESYDSLIADESESLDPHPAHPLDASGIYYTGGTTGQPKGCIYTHISEISCALINDRARAASKLDVFLSHAPMGHSFGNAERINFPFYVGAAAIYARRMTPTKMFECAERFGATILAGAATMYRMMLRDVERPLQQFPGLRLKNAMSAGEVLDAATQERWERELSFPLRNVVGSTPIRQVFLESNRHGEKVAPGLSVGAPLEGFEARLIDPNDGRTVGDGELGQLCLRGPSGITYWTNLNPALVERAALDVREGWSVSDDIYVRDEGWFYFQSRVDDMIVTAGRQVAAIEVEQVLSAHPAVAEVAVVGAPDPMRGQVVKAFVVLRPGHDGVDATVLQEFSKRSMAKYKYPREIEFVAQLPKDAVGKIRRRALRQGAGGASNE